MNLRNRTIAATAAAFSLVILGGVSTAAAQGANDSEPLAVLNSFTRSLDQVRESSAVSARMAPQVSGSAASVRSAQGDREAFAEGGLTINESDTSVDVLSTRPLGNTGESVVMADVTTTTQSRDRAGNLVESSWTDTHRYVIREGDQRAYVAADTIVPSAELGTQDFGVPKPSASDASSEDPSVVEPVTPESRAQPRISTSKFSAYALKYTTFPYSAQPQGNPKYPAAPKGGTNCANFASQVLHAAGWKLKNGVNRFDTNNWHYNLTGPATFSRTWSKASTLYYYARTKQNWSRYSSVWSAKTGDLIFVDWTPKGKPDGSIDHVMVVSGHVVGVYAGHWNMPLISQKNSNRHNIPLTQSIKLANDQGLTKRTWWALKHR